MKHFLVVLAACAPISFDLVAPPQPASVDFDGDGLADLAFAVTGTDSDAIAVYLGRDQGKLSQRIALPTRRWDAPSISLIAIGAVGDLDGDGRSELAVVVETNAVGELWLLRGTPAGLAGRPYQRLQLPLDGEWYGTTPRAAGDVDGDGRPDIVLGDTLLRGGRDGALAGYQRMHAGRLLPVGDVDGDGAADLVAVDGGNSWLVRGGPTLAIGPLDIDGVADAVDVDGERRLVAIGGPRRLIAYRWEHGAPVAAPSVPELPLAMPPLVGSLDLARIHAVAGVGRDLVVATSATLREVVCNTRCWAPAEYGLATIRDGAVVRADAVDPDVEPDLMSPGDVDGDGVPDLVVRLGGRVIVHASRRGDVVLALPSS